MEFFYIVVLKESMRPSMSSEYTIIIMIQHFTVICTQLMHVLIALISSFVQTSHAVDYHNYTPIIRLDYKIQQFTVCRVLSMISRLF